MRLPILLCLFIFFSLNCFTQDYTRKDTLRGTITPERAWWDLSHYDLRIRVDIENKSVTGSNKIGYKVLKPHKVIQIDLQPPMEIFEITQDGEYLNFHRDENAYFIQLEKEQIEGSYNQLNIKYGGIPRVAPRPPWDSGLVWSKDSLGYDFISSVSWGAGSSQWWPCKDHMYDEVDSLNFSINVPEELVAVANGRLINIDKKKDKTKTFHWKVLSPINNYGVNFNIGNYTHFSEVYKGEKGPLDCSYYVLKHNLKKAKNQFYQVAMMLEAFEHWFGPYPFYEDSYKLVEVPYLGMEHQSATTFGNNYKNRKVHVNAANSDKPPYFNHIIIHESGHEWFACNITFKDIADIWIHESFTTYSEGLFVEYHFGKETGNRYQIAKRTGIRNDRPMIGDYNVNDINYSGDNYSKGAVILHMLRQIVNDDSTWREILRGLNREFYHQTVTTAQIENYITEQSGLKLDTFWDQYLRTTQYPVLEYFVDNKKMYFRWANAIEGFFMPLKLFVNGKETWVHPKGNWQELKWQEAFETLIIDPNFFVAAYNVQAN